MITRKSIQRRMRKLTKKQEELASSAETGIGRSCWHARFHAVLINALGMELDRLEEQLRGLPEEP